MTLRGRTHPHFIFEAAEAQGDKVTCPRPHSWEGAEVQLALPLSAFGVSSCLPALCCFLLLHNLRCFSSVCGRGAPCRGPENHSFVQTLSQWEGSVAIATCRGHALLGAGDTMRKETRGGGRPGYWETDLPGRPRTW